MRQTVSLRTLRDEDRDQIIDMLRRMWYSYDGLEPEVAERLAELDWEHCLSASSEAIVAVEEGSGATDGMRIAGIILGRIESRKRRGRGLRDRHLRRVARLGLALSASKQGRDNLTMLARFAAANHALLADAIGQRAGEPYPAEVTLFLVDDAMRGQGVGGRLYEAMMARFAESGVDEYFLYTDDTCDVSFYDHNGLARMGERTVRFPDFDGIQYLYQGSVPGGRQ